MPVCARIRKNPLSGPNYDLIRNSCFPLKKKVHPIIENVYEFRENLTKQTECMICLEKLFQEGRNTISLSCDHFFHADCLRTYSQHYLKTYEKDFCCPLCRTNDTYTRRPQMREKAACPTQSRSTSRLRSASHTR